MNHFAFYTCLASLLLAAPQLAAQPSEDSVPVILVFDMSFSMGVSDRATADFDIENPPPTRFQRTQTAMQAFLAGEGSANTRVGLVVFGRNAFVQSPITSDRVAVSTFVQQMTLGDIDGSGAAIGNGVAQAISLVRHESEPWAIILVTDGNQNAGTIGVEDAAFLEENEDLFDELTERTD